MPAPRIPKDEVIRMLRAGIKQAEIVKHLQQKYGLEVTPQAIGMIRSRANIPATQARYTNLLPWRVPEVHNRLHIPAMLRLEARRRAGERLNDDQTKQIDSFLSRLKENDWVIHYEENDPTGRGWYYFPREAYDTDIIRDPSMVK